MEFVKMEGLGNDFVLLVGPRPVSAEEARRWCDRRRGIGADGVLVAVRTDSSVRMDYRNADGSVAETCGNGLRCVARFAFDQGWTSGPGFVVETAAGPSPAEVQPDGTVRVRLAPSAGSPGDEVEIAGFDITPLKMGNPHAVIVVDDCYATPVEAIGPVVEGDPAFPERTNVEFLTVAGRSRAALRVWERGVGETLACGTGAAAAVVVAHRKGLVDDRVTVQLPGGALEVAISEDGVWIEGPANYVYRGEID